MPRFHLNCRMCGNPLRWEPSNGLTLHYRCAQHGLLTLRPLLELDAVDEDPSPGVETMDPADSYESHTHHHSW
jgi:hypothetical protein